MHARTHANTQLKNMIAALHSSRQEGAKDFMRKGSHFGWDTIVGVYKADLYRAKQGITRRVPALKYAYIVRDAWTRLNVLPAKIVQVKYDTSQLLLQYTNGIAQLQAILSFAVYSNHTCLLQSRRWHATERKWKKPII